MHDSQANFSDLVLDLDGRGPLHARISAALRRAIRERRIAVGQALPPSRALAADLGVSRWAVTQAYGQLVAEGYLEARTGSATRVRWAPDLPAPPGYAAAGKSGRERFDLAPGLPDLRAFPRRRWAGALTAAAAAAGLADLGYPQPGGHPRLRAVLADHARRSRDAVAGAGDVAVGTSVTHCVSWLCAALRAAGITAVGWEDPGWSRLRDTIRTAGVEVVPIGTDGGGLRVDELREHAGLRAVLTTPAHHFPEGTVLTPSRRGALLRWARDVDGVVIEDDYDAEYRYDRAPVGTLQGMAPRDVVLLKSLSKTLSPAVGIGWAVAPQRWRTHLDRMPGPPVLDQLAFASMIESGAYDRHLRRCRQRYRRRRDALVAALTAALPRASVSGVAAGLHLVLHLPEGTDAAAVRSAAARRSVRVVELAGYHARPDRAPSGLVLGYGNLADSAVDEAVQLLAEAIAEAARQEPGGSSPDGPPPLRRLSRAQKEVKATIATADPASGSTPS